MKQHEFNTVVFDLGGVIINLNVPRCVDNFKRLMGEENVRNVLGIDDEGEGVAAVSAATRQLMHDYEHGNISTDDFLSSIQSYCHLGTTIQQVREAWMSMLSDLPQERLDYIAVLRQAGYKTVLLSNSNQMHWDPIYEQYHLDRYFDRIFASHHLHMAKPTQEMFEYVAREAQIDSAHTIYVDDLDKNRAAAEKYLGWQTCATIEELKMKEILNHFAIPNAVADPQPLKIGFINDSFIVRAKNPGEKSYFLQRINHHIFQNVEGLQQNIQKVTNHIRRKLQEAGETDIERKVLELVPTTDGKLYYRTPQGDYWRVYVLIENATSQEKVTPESAELTGEAFGRFQRQLSDLPFDELCESIPNFHNIEFRLHQLDEALAADVAGRKAACADIIAAIDRRREEMCLAERLFREGKLPKHINHCDTKVNNILFDEAGRPICIVDLDTVMPGFVLSDFGDFMRTAANTGQEDDKILDNIRVDLQIFEAYARGYLKQATFLTDIEKELLPYGCRLLSYMQTVRFFTDWLNGDTYYKILYPEHNLVRTRAQLRLLEEQEKVADEMANIIRKLS
ncbi:MAG: HAD-IA family hydrolase [Paludibacteraceae bacterium]|nr:HAD-IA family hydrolase [Paludibacteraceae bacterium]